MAALCSFSGIIGWKRGSSRGCKDFVALKSCEDDVSSHLKTQHLSKENVSEKDLILESAGLLEITEEQIENMTIYPAHRHNLGKYWQAPKTCQYPKHQGKKTKRNDAVHQMLFIQLQLHPGHHGRLVTNLSPAMTRLGIQGTNQPICHRATPIDPRFPRGPGARQSAVTPLLSHLTTHMIIGDRPTEKTPQAN